MAIKKDTLHPEGEPEIDIYPKTSIDQVENLQANLDALNGDIANANGEIANISANVESKLDKTGGIISGTLTITGTSNANIYEVKGSKILDYKLSTKTNEIYGININNIVNNKFEVTKGNIKVSLDMTKVGANDEFALKSNLPNTSLFATIEDIPNYNSVADVSYDTTNGAIIYYTNGKLITIPIKAGDGVTIDADETNHNILISAPGGGSSTPQYNRGIDSTTPTTFTYELGVYHTLTITLLSTYVSTTIILPNDYDGSSIDIELEGKSFLIMVVAGLLSVRNTTDNTEWVGKLE